MKRLFDFFLALLLFVLLLPLMVITSILIKIKLGSPIIFTQPRPGLHEKIFNLKKFRTMTDVKDLNGQLLPDDKRLTSFGRFLRKTSLDELPQLWNILKGEMSFIGPRPLLVEYLPLYNDFQRRRFEVRPGITGWAQVNGRNAISWEEKFKYDVWYMDHRGFWLDFKIFFMTIKKVFCSEGVSQAGEATMEKFRGNK